MQQLFMSLVCAKECDLKQSDNRTSRTFWLALQEHKTQREVGLRVPVQFVVDESNFPCFLWKNKEAIAFVEFAARSFAVEGVLVFNEADSSSPNRVVYFSRVYRAGQGDQVRIGSLPFPV